MIYIVHRKLISLKTEFVITDQSGMPRYRVESKIFSWGNRLSLNDSDSQCVANIEERILRWKPTYEVYQQKNLLARITKEGWFWTWYNVEASRGPNFKIQSNFWGTRYWFAGEGRHLAEVHKPLFSISKVCEINICDDEMETLLLAAFIILQKNLDRENSQSQTRSSNIN